MSRPPAKKAKGPKRGAPPPVDPQVARRARIHTLAEKFVGESPLKSPEGKKRMARTAAALYVVLEQLVEEKLSGVYNVEEARTIPSLASNFKRFMNDLRITEEILDEEDDDDDED